WAHTQTPALHERWDLRFSRIDYLPRALDTEPQRFRYTTRIAFGFEVSGEGETAGQRDLTDGSRSSALKFGSDEAFSTRLSHGRSWFQLALFWSSYAQANPLLESGSCRIRFPVAAKIAFAAAGSAGGNAGSPSPVGGLSVLCQ